MATLKFELQPTAPIFHLRCSLQPVFRIYAIADRGDSKSTAQNQILNFDCMLPRLKETLLKSMYGTNS
jgi:hypothetical protein